MTATEREQWLAERRKGIGASDSAAICGLSPWRSALHVYMDKIGLLPDSEPSPAMRWGLRLEPLIAEAYQEQTGIALEQPPPVMRHKSHDWMLASLDRLAKDRVVELKFAPFSRDWGQPGTDSIPEQYIIQTSHQLAVAGMEVADVAVLLGSLELRVYRVDRNDLLIDRLIEICGEFWGRVCRLDPPEPSWEHPSTLDLIRNMYGINGQIVDLPEEAVAYRQDYEALGRQIKELEQLRATAQGRLLFEMKDALAGRLPSGEIVERKQISVKEYTVPAKTCTRIYFRRPRRFA